MITIVDYGAGNLRSVVNGFDAIGQNTHVTNNPKDLEKASAIVLPGVGAFGDGMTILARLGLLEPLKEQILGKNKPYLGICLGLQFLATESLEHGQHQGFGWLDGTVSRITPDDPMFRVPHMGWNNITIERPSPLFEGLGPEPVFYFVHSYHLVPEGGASDAVTATCWHGATINVAVQRDNIFGVQFHPEKSQGNGLKVLENFVKLI